MAKFKIGDRVRKTATPSHLTSINVIPVGTVGTIAAGPFGSKNHPFAGRSWWHVDGFAYPPGMDQTHEDTLELVPPERQQTIPWWQCEFQPRDLHITA